MKYNVQIYEVHTISVDVEADSEDDAKSKAMDKLESSDTLDIEYSHTLEQDEWVVSDITKQSLVEV